MANKDFELFQKTFTKYQKLFGLTGYKVYFKHEPIENCFAQITVAQTDMVATVRLNSDLPDKDEPHKDIKQSAKHEALHLLVMRLEINAEARYSTSAEIYEATEELIVKLEGLINEDSPRRSMAPSRPRITTQRTSPRPSQRMRQR